MGQQKLLKVTTSKNVATLTASYLVASRIAKAKKPFTIGEELICQPLKTFAGKCLVKLQLTL